MSLMDYRINVKTNPVLLEEEIESNPIHISKFINDIIRKTDDNDQ